MSAHGDPIIPMPYIEPHLKAKFESPNPLLEPNNPKDSAQLSRPIPTGILEQVHYQDCIPQPVPIKSSVDKTKIPRCLFAVFYLLLTAFYGSVCFHGSVLPVAFFFPRLFRYLVDGLLLSWLRLAEVIICKILGVRVRHFGDPILESSASNPKSSLLLLNHRTQLDWFFIWGLGNPVQKMKIILKDSLAKLPGPGWAMQCGSFVFLRRRLSVDLPRLDLLIRYILKTTDSCQLLIFPEGTDLNPQSLKRSDEFAQKSNLPQLRYTLHPRSTGFLHLVDALSPGHLTEIYDVTIGYPDTLPSPETDIFKGYLPNEVHYHVTRFSVSDLPKDPQGLTQWLQNRWLIKEKMLKEYYAQPAQERRFPNERHPNSLMFRVNQSTDSIEWTWLGLLNTAFWISTLCLWVYALFVSRLVLLHFVIVQLVFVYLSHWGEGVTPWAAQFAGLKPSNPAQVVSNGGPVTNSNHSKQS